MLYNVLLFTSNSHFVLILYILSHFCYNYGHNILRILAYKILSLPNVKRSLIINNKHGIYKLPHELLNEFRLRILGQ